MRLIEKYKMNNRVQQFLGILIGTSAMLICCIGILQMEKTTNFFVSLLILSATMLTTYLVLGISYIIAINSIKNMQEKV